MGLNLFGGHGLINCQVCWELFIVGTMLGMEGIKKLLPGSAKGFVEIGAGSQNLGEEGGTQLDMVQLYLVAMALGHSRLALFIMLTLVC